MTAPRQNAGSPTIRKPWQPRFSLGAMMLVTAICTILASALHYLVRGASNKDQISQMIGILIITAGPVVVVILMGLFFVIKAWINRRRR